jgi:hypothetical protein
MSVSLFNSYSVKGSLKFYKSHDDDQKLVVSIAINADHQVDKNIYAKLSEFLETLLIEDYINEDSYKSILLHEKSQKLAAKEQAKYLKTQEKLKKQATKKKVVNKTKSLH